MDHIPLYCAFVNGNHQPSLDFSNKISNAELIVFFVDSLNTLLKQRVDLPVIWIATLFLRQCIIPYQIKSAQWLNVNQCWKLAAVSDDLCYVSEPDHLWPVDTVWNVKNKQIGRQEKSN